VAFSWYFLSLPRSPCHGIGTKTALCWRSLCETRYCHRTLVRVRPNVLSIFHYFLCSYHEVITNHNAGPKKNGHASTSVASRALGIRQHVRFLIGLRKSATLLPQRWSRRRSTKNRSPFLPRWPFQSNQPDPLSTIGSFWMKRLPQILVGSLSPRQRPSR
jgi:hypothetical protein